MTIKEYADSTTRRLAALYPENEARWMTRIIFEQLKGYSQVDMIVHADDKVSDFIASKIEAVIARLLRHEPIQYIFGTATFYGLTLKVNSDVLIPRPETEELVDMIIRQADGRDDLRVADICTGSGCIAIALARNLRFPIVTAIDISAKAINVAKENARLTHVNINLRQADALQLPHPVPGSFDIIVSNPPYIADSERTTMPPNVTNYEPAIALFVPDDDPLRFYHAISRWAFTALTDGGKIYFEINPHYATELSRWMTAQRWDNVETYPDMQKLTRFLTAQKPRQ